MRVHDQVGAAGVAIAMLDPLDGDFQVIPERLRVGLLVLLIGQLLDLSGDAIFQAKHGIGIIWDADSIHRFAESGDDLGCEFLRGGHRVFHRVKLSVVAVRLKALMIVFPLSVCVAWQ